MEFHDVLHGHIVIEHPEVKDMVRDLISSTELQRLRNMRQMNFDVPLIQELGRSRRLPHSIGVAHVALTLAQQGQLTVKEIKELVAAALLHDAAIPPYGHLVETEFKQNKIKKFDHADILKSFIFGTFPDRNSFTEILPKRQLEVNKVLNRHDVDPDKVFELVAPHGNKKSPIAADVDLDNIDNVHRMAVLLGWKNAKENTKKLLDATKLNSLKQMRFTTEAVEPLRNWLDFREKIYTLIIAHPECIPHNALQSDLVESAVINGVISNDNWYLSEPEFEDNLRKNEKTKDLAEQLISGCNYSFIDYVWIKNIDTQEKLKNSDVKRKMSESIDFELNDTGYFIWSEKGLISREINWLDENGKKHRLGENSKSCMIALVKKTPGGKATNDQKSKWREAVVAEFECLAKTRRFDLAFPEDYSGSYFSRGTNEFELKLQ
ncbi:HD domain-containing protein [Exilibacterium tricleocarpae]|uniref:HD domain-containing protein n=1 Tax=Exilibacterium tricleocarpae TaxID=2591008 RepID=A0A545TUY9_9GAMM|nr:HD domain-containing protein [Exilibacterium tricleocarpae]TQV81034.1 HD domain-containing protein [Exilibacterium tricleocarpae]